MAAATSWNCWLLSSAPVVAMIQVVGVTMLRSIVCLSSVLPTVVEKGRLGSFFDSISCLLAKSSKLNPDGLRCSENTNVSPAWSFAWKTSTFSLGTYLNELSSMVYPWGSFWGIYIGNDTL